MCIYILQYFSLISQAGRGTTKDSHRVLVVAAKDALVVPAASRFISACRRGDLGMGRGEIDAQH